MGVNVPEEYGGAAAGAVSYALAMIEIAQGCASTAVTLAVNNMVAETLCRFGSEAQKAKYVPEITSARFVAASFGLSRSHCGSDAAALRTTATRDGNEFVLNGSKQWISSGDRAGVIIVWARTDSGVAAQKGISCFLVEQGARGLHVGKKEDKMGLRASSTVSLAFDELRVPAGAMLGGEGQGFAIAMTALDGGRIGIASQAVGIGTAGPRQRGSATRRERRALESRSATSRPCASCSPTCDTELSAARLLALRAAALKAQGLPFTQAGSMAKLFASEKANRACDIAVQVHGGYGYSTSSPPSGTIATRA